MSVHVKSQCAHCGRPLHMEIDGDMNCRCADSDCAPIIFVPKVDFSTLKDPHIIDAF